jgi:hypothetical protein
MQSAGRLAGTHLLHGQASWLRHPRAWCNLAIDLLHSRCHWKRCLVLLRNLAQRAVEKDLTRPPNHDWKPRGDNLVLDLRGILMQLGLRSRIVPAPSPSRMVVFLISVIAYTSTHAQPSLPQHGTRSAGV